MLQVHVNLWNLLSDLGINDLGWAFVTLKTRAVAETGVGSGVGERGTGSGEGQGLRA